MADEIKKNNKHLINAPAGSGKTTYIRNQLKSICINKPESRILCITYTNRAADELKKDLENANITVSTIHSYINDLISPFYSHKEVLDLYCEIYAEKINERIANVTNDEHIKQSNQYYTEKYGKLTEKAVRENLLEISYGETPFTSLYTGKLSHDDLLMFASKLIKRYPVLLKKIGDKYNYIFIDEYQDTSSYVLDIFYDAVKNRENVQIYLFGDRMQQIYRNYDGSFEGKLKEFDTSDRLEVNFRSIGKIVSILNNIYNDSSFEQQPTESNANVVPDIEPHVIISSNVPESIYKLQNKFPKILVLYLMNKEKYEEIGAKNLYDAYRGMEAYTFGRKYSPTDILSDMSNDNPDILMKFLFLLNNVIGLYIDKNYGMVISICKKENKYFDSSQFKIKKHADKKSIKNKFDKIIEIYEKDGCLIREVIESLFDNGFIPEKVKNDFEENIEYQKVLDIEMKEVSNLANYLSMPHISTQHGVKGESHECYVYLVELAVDTARNENEKLVELIDQLGYMYEPTLTDYLECLENSFEFGTDENTFEVWLKLRECMARIEPTEGKVIYKQLDRIQQLIEKMEPTDIRVKHRECYLGNRCLFDKGNYANRWKMLEDKKLSVVKEIFDEYGSEEVERFGCAVKNVHDVANKLGRFLRPNEMSSIIEKYFIGILSKEFTINCLISFVYTQGAEKLLETSLCQMEDEFMLEILSKIPFSLQLLDVINQVLDDDTAYWEKGAMPYSCYDAEELKIIVEKLVACKRYVTAVNIIGHSECEAVINAECIYKLMKLAGTEESIGVETLDDYAVQKIIGWFQQQEDIDLELRSDIEFIYLPMLDEYSEVRPRALNTRLSLEPEYFCSLIELFYKERNGEKREIELNKSLSDRLYEILFQFKVIPGIDWNGNFDAKRFDYWMKTVKTWSRDNDRYEVAMHTVGSGLSYAELDEDKLPQTAIIEELNRVENEELRRGYYLGIINQRGVHWIDPEGKPELELAEDYENKANIAESRGYSRYAGILRGVADAFKREAKSNILEAKNGDDE